MSTNSPSSKKSPKQSAGKADSAGQAPKGFWQTYRQEILFIGLFVGILSVGFTLISIQAVNDSVIVPFTSGVAKASGIALNLIGQGIEMKGTMLRNDRFAVNIKNGCNGVETMIIFLAAVVAFPASWKAKTIGLVLGSIAIQFVNLIRVVALFLTGAYFPALFDSSHTVIWQTIVILFGVLLWIFWANKFVASAEGATTE